MDRERKKGKTILGAGSWGIGAVLGGFWGDGVGPRAILGSLGAIWGGVGATLGVLEGFRANPGGVLGGPGPVLGRSWEGLERLGGRLGRSW